MQTYEHKTDDDGEGGNLRRRWISWSNGLEQPRVNCTYNTGGKSEISIGFPVKKYDENCP